MNNNNMLKLNKAGDVLISCSKEAKGIIEIPYGVKSIGEEAFKDCKSLESIEIPNSVTYIGDKAFCGCTSLTSIEIPNSMTTIGYEAFCNCTSLISLKIPNSVKSIGYEAFCNCTSLVSIEIPNSVIWIDCEAFNGCTSLASIEIPNSVIDIGYEAFCNCTSLASIEIPNSVIKIGYFVFRDCTSLTSIKIPNSVTEIGFGAFYGCASLKSIFVANNNPSYISVEDVLYTKDMKTLVCFPSKKNSTTFKIPDNVTTIAGAAFSRCTELLSLEIPYSVTCIIDNVFEGVENLKEIHMKIEHIEAVSVYGEQSFSDILTKKCTLYVPVGTGYAYRHHPVFGKFEHVVIESNRK